MNMIVYPKTKYGCEERVLVECDFKISTKCRGQYLKLYKNIVETHNRHDGKDICIYCSNSMIKTGSQNYNFKFSKNENVFEIIDSELKSYLLGWVAGDGCLKKDGLYIAVHQKDVEILELFKQTISPTSNITYREYDHTCNLHIYSVKIMKDLCRHLKLKGPGKKSHDIVLPELSDDLQWHFIRGLMDSDGHIRNAFNYTSPYCSICSMSIKIRQQIYDFCKENDIESHIKLDSINNFDIRLFGQECIRFLDKLYMNANFVLSRKMEMWKIWKTWVPFNGTSARPRKVRMHYPPLTEEHKEAIRASNRKRKGRIYKK